MNPSKRAHLAGPACVLLVCLTVTAVGGWQLSLAIEARDAERFAREAARTRELVVARLDAVIAWLDSAAGLVAATGRMQADDLHAFVAPRGLQRHPAGIQAIGWTRRLVVADAADREALRRVMRAEGGLDFELRHDPERHEYQPVVAVEAIAPGEQLAIGDDLFSDPVRRAVMERSRDAGVAALSGQAASSRAPGRPAPPGFVVFLPIYRDGRVPATVEERRAKLFGFAFSPVRTDELLAGIVDRAQPAPLSFALFDGAPEARNTVLDSLQGQAAAVPARFTTRSVVELGGRNWTFTFASAPGFESLSPTRLVLAALAAGVLASLLLAAAFWARAAARVAAQTAADGLRQAQRDAPAQRESFRTALAGIRDAVIITDSGGRVGDLNAAAQSLTGWRLDETDEALRQNDERFRFLAEVLPQKIFTARPDGEVDYFNRQWTEFTGQSFAAIKGWGWQQFVHPDDVAEYLSCWRRSLASGEPFLFERRIRRADGAYRWHLSRAHAMRDAQGKAVVWIGSDTDVDDTKRAEQQRAEMLDRERVLRAQAEAANRAKDEFLATLSHELRTPLNAILGWTQTLLKGNTRKDTFLRALNQIKRSAKAQARLIDDLLNVSDIVAGRLRLEVQPMRLSAAIEAAVESLRPAIDAKAITLVGALDPAADAITGDAVRLQQVVWNLLANAVKFTPRGGDIRLTLARTEQGVEIAVADSGEGISAEFLPYVFKRFRQADASSKRRHGGLGLGLAIVRHLVELHGGTVAAESAGIGQGASFTVRLPVRRQAPAAAALAPAAAPEAATRRRRLAGLRILSVDDDGNTREMLQEALERAGAEVQSAASAAEALAALPRFRPDVLVSDIGLPEQDGYSLLRQIRALPPEQGGAIPAVALTGYAREQDRAASLKAGYQAFTAKPVDLDELFALIVRLVNRAT